MLEVGQSAPRFTLPDADMETVSLSDFKGRNVVLYFYPRDGTPGCILQSIEFSDHEAYFEAQNCVVIGVSCDDCLTHAEFRDEHGLSVRLLSDTEGEVCKIYGVFREGNGHCSVQRSTFIIDKSGKLKHALYGVNPRGHV
ncbi:MAG TPA: peroxiredoxin, partial [Burkholderiales bacterium]|nr:peroxiredoxin [Burkholderiales bacterium]